MTEDKTVPEDMSRRDELEALLPFYLNGTLEGDDLVAVEQWLTSDVAAITALGEAEAEFSGVAAVNEAIRPPADALSRFAKAIDAEAGPVAAKAGPSTIVQLWNRFTAIPASAAWAVAAAALAFVLVQATIEPGRQAPDFEVAGTPEDRATVPFALVTFRPDATIADINALLAANGGSIFAGPASGGVFKIAIAATTVADYDRVVGLIAAAPVVETVLPGRKPVDGG